MRPLQVRTPPIPTHVANLSVRSAPCKTLMDVANYGSDEDPCVCGGVRQHCAQLKALGRIGVGRFTMTLLTRAETCAKVRRTVTD